MCVRRADGMPKMGRRRGDTLSLSYRGDTAVTKTPKRITGP